MELPMHSHRWAPHVPNWPVAAVAEFTAGAVMMVLELLWSALVVGASPWTISHMVAAIVMGPGVLQSADFSFNLVALALATHYVLGVAFGIVLSAIIASLRLDSSARMVVLIGAAFGLALYVLNFYGMVRFFPWFAGIRGWATVAPHLVFGTTAALMYWKLSPND